MEKICMSLHISPFKSSGFPTGICLWFASALKFLHYFPFFHQRWVTKILQEWSGNDLCISMAVECSQQVEFKSFGKREFYLNFKMYWLTLGLKKKETLLQSSSCQHLPSESILVHLRVLYRMRALYFPYLPAVNILIAHSMPSAMSYFFPLLYNECLNLILHSTWNLFLWKWQKAWDSDCCCSFCWLFDKWQRVWVFWDLVSFQFTKGLIQNLWRQQKSCCLWIGP